MTNLLRMVAACGLALILIACGGGDSSSGSGHSSPDASLERRIIVIGDSTSSGNNASFAYPDMLASLTGVPVINLAKDGQPAEYGARNIAEFMERYKPQYVVVLLGTLNASGGNGGGVNAAVNSLQHIANYVHASGAIAVIGTIPPISRDAASNANANAINNGIRGISNARIAPVNENLDIRWIADGLHPNDHGQGVIAHVFASQIY